MSTDNGHSVPRDLFSAPPSAPARLQYAAAGIGYAPMPAASGPKRPGALRRAVPWIAVAWGGLDIVYDVFHGLEFSVSTAYGFGHVVGFLTAIAMVVGGSREITSEHVRRVRWLPWLMGVETTIVALAIVAVLVVRPAYPDGVQANLMSGCEVRGGSPSYCGCVLHWWESNRTFAQYLAEFSSTPTEAARADMDIAVSSCETQK
jgi:hypothetical protein